MEVKEKISQDLKDALKKREKERISVLRLLISAIKNKEVQKRFALAQKYPDLSEEKLVKESELNQQEIFEVILSEVKKRKEAIEEFKKCSREDLAKKEEREIEILKGYLPPEASPKEIEKLAFQTIQKLSATEQDFGKVMGILMEKLKGRVEGKLVASIVKKLLQEKE